MLSANKITSRRDLGNFGERLAVAFLQQQGYQIVACNFITRLGRSLTNRPLTGEIDIIAYDGATLCFIEVKTRTSEQFATPEEAVDRAKQRQILRTALRYRQLFAVYDEDYRFDVVAILRPTASDPEIRLTRGFFSPQQVRKRAFCWQRLKA